jgi:hypothetical protein
VTVLQFSNMTVFQTLLTASLVFPYSVPPAQTTKAVLPVSVRRGNNIHAFCLFATARRGFTLIFLPISTV